MLHRFANFASRSASTPCFLTKVGRFDDCLFNVGRRTVLDYQFLELLCFRIICSSVSRVFSRDKLRFKCKFLHLQLFILLTHSISKTFSLFILHQAFTIQLVADVIWVILAHWLDGSQSLRHWLSDHQYLMRSIKALILSGRRLLLHDRWFVRSLS